MLTQSHLLEAVAYDQKSHLLRAKYRDSGKTIVFEEVPQEIYDSLLFADSIGGFFHDRIEGRFRVRES